MTTITTLLAFVVAALAGIVGFFLGRRPTTTLSREAVALAKKEVAEADAEAERINADARNTGLCDFLRKLDSGPRR